MALAKLALLAIAFKSGFLGGPTFPAIFASVCAAMAISLILPGIVARGDRRRDHGGFLMVLFKAPFMVILLTAIMLGAGPDLTALIVLAVAAVMIVEPYAFAAIERLQARRAGAGGGRLAAAAARWVDRGHRQRSGGDRRGVGRRPDPGEHAGDTAAG